MDQNRCGLLVVYTGTGKGKTTAALGLALRAHGQGLRVGVVQFIKPAASVCGEHRALADLGIFVDVLGDGFSWQLGNHAAQAQAAWQQVQALITDGGLDMLVLDEFTYPLAFKWIDPQMVIDWIKAHRPAGLHLVITGRDAPAVLLKSADLVTEMKEVRHPYRTRGLCAQAGIEY